MQRYFKVANNAIWVLILIVSGMPSFWRKAPLPLVLKCHDHVHSVRGDGKAEAPDVSTTDARTAGTLEKESG